MKTLENLRSTLRSKQPKADGKLAMLINSPPFCVAWHNKALGSIDEINWFNRWYGDEPRYGRNSVTLLFPTAYAYKCTAKNKEELEKIVANPKNWKYDKYCNDKKGLFLRTKNHKYKVLTIIILIYNAKTKSRVIII